MLSDLHSPECISLSLHLSKVTCVKQLSLNGSFFLKAGHGCPVFYDTYLTMALTTLTVNLLVYDKLLKTKCLISVPLLTDRGRRGWGGVEGDWGSTTEYS